MPHSMTSRERVNAMFERRDHDRAPRYESFWPETLERWREEGVPGKDRFEAADYVRDRLGSDMQIGGVLYWPHPFPSRAEVLDETEETETVLGQSGQILRRWKNKSGTPEHIGFECNSRDVWETKYKPALESLPVNIDVDEQRKNHARGRKANRWVFTAGVEPFEALRLLIGDEEFMINILEDPEWIADMAKVTTDNSLMNYRALVDAGLEFDGLWIYGDMAFKNMMFCSPESYRELIWPQHRRLVDFAHAHGMKFIYHSDGDLRKAMDLYVEAGFDCLQPLEAKANMNICELVPQYGDKLAFFGNVDVMEMIANDRDPIEAEVKMKVTAGKEKRGYIYHSDHSIPPQVSWETYQFVISLVEQYGRYT